MTRPLDCLPRLAPVAMLLLGLALPAAAAAQAAERVGADAPSRNRETVVQHDSLAVHFLRSPKAKPATRSGAGTVAASAKFRGRREPIESVAPIATPLPSKTGAIKR